MTLLPGRPLQNRSPSRARLDSPDRRATVTWIIPAGASVVRAEADLDPLDSLGRERLRPIDSGLATRRPCTTSGTAILRNGGSNGQTRGQSALKTHPNRSQPITRVRWDPSDGCPHLDREFYAWRAKNWWTGGELNARHRDVQSRARPCLRADLRIRGVNPGPTSRWIFGRGKSGGR